MSFDGYQNLYVADTSNHRIQYFSRGFLFSLQFFFSNFHCLIKGSSTGTTVAGNSGAAGSGYSELYNPYAIHVDSNRLMYILDTSNCRVLKWQFGDPLGYVTAAGRGCGSQLYQISTSYAMFVDNQANIYISDNANHRVTLWLSNNLTTGVLVFFSLVPNFQSVLLSFEGRRREWSRKYNRTII